MIDYPDTRTEDELREACHHPDTGCPCEWVPADPEADKEEEK